MRTRKSRDELDNVLVGVVGLGLVLLHAYLESKRQVQAAKAQPETIDIDYEEVKQVALPIPSEDTSKKK